MDARLHWRRDDAGQVRLMIRIDGPQDIKGSAYLVIENKPRDTVYMYLPSLVRPRRVVGGGGSSIWGTDFSHEDLRLLQMRSDALGSVRLADAEVAAVDGHPGDAEPVLATLRRNGLELDSILLTHHHADHIGGVAELVKATGAAVYGPHEPRIPGQARSFADGEILELEAPALSFRVLEVPGHTSSHIAFFGHGCLFCGDTLFSVGCGRLFEGTPDEMQASLDKMAALPPETRVFCAHEYTLSNCDFARAVEPDNAALAQRASEVEAARAQSKKWWGDDRLVWVNPRDSNHVMKADDGIPYWPTLTAIAVPV